METDTTSAVTIDVPASLKNEIDLVKKVLDDGSDNLEEFNEFYKRCTNLIEIETLLVRYKHLTKNPADWGNGVVYEPLGRPICIGYLLNEDKIFYSELDTTICNYFRNEGAIVVPFIMSDFCYKGSGNGVEILVKGKPAQFDGFLTYGYRKKSSMEVYTYIAHIMEESGVSIKYSSANVPIPDTYEIFNASKADDLFERIDNQLIPCVLKPLDDYGGEGLLKYENKYAAIRELNRTHWCGRNLLLQKLIPDSIGHSIRVLCFDGKAFALAEYEDQSGGFTSNFCYGDKFRLISLMDSPKYEMFKELSEKAIKSIGNVLIGGVDLLDSKERGVVVLEVNGWPDIFDIWFVTNKCGFKQLAVSFMNKIKTSIELKQQQEQTATSS